MFEWAAPDTILYGTILSYTLVVLFVGLLLLFLLEKQYGLREKLSCLSNVQQYLFLFLLVILAFSVRLPFAQINELAYDEPYYISASLLYIEGFGEGVGSSNFVANFEHPPLIKYLLGVHLKLGFPAAHLDYTNQISDYTLLYHARLFNVLLGAFTIVPLFFLAQRIKSGLGIIAGLLFALNPSHARMSGLAYLDVGMIFFALCSFLFFIRLLEKNSLKNMALYGVFVGFLLSTKWLQPLVYIISMAALTILCWKRITHYLLSLAMGFGVMIVLWTPLIWNFGVFRIPDFIGWVNSHWVPQFTSATSDGGLLKMALWNMTLLELSLFVGCSAIGFYLFLSCIWARKLNYKRVLSIVVIMAFVISLLIERRGAVYYWTMITPFICIIMGQSLDFLYITLKKRLCWMWRCIHSSRKYLTSATI